MKRSFLLKIILILWAFGFSSCKYYTYGLEEFLYRSGTVEKRTESVLELTGHDVPVVPNEGNYNFLIVADIHFGHQVYKNDVDWLITSVTDYLNTIPEDEKPLFCICLGDIAEHGLKSEFDDFTKFVNKLNELGIKTYSVLGNHDLYNSGWRIYKDVIFPFTSFYYFKTDVFSFYFIDSASGSLGKSQMNKLENLLTKDEKPKIVATHVPLYADGYFYFAMQNTTERNLLISMLARNNVKAVLSGHTHSMNFTNLGKFTEYNFPSVITYNDIGIVTVNQSDNSVYAKVINLNK